MLVVAGEASGDLHAAAALRALRVRAPDVELFGMGGDHARAAGLRTLFDAKEISVMGITEVLGKIPRVFELLDALEDACRESPPDVALLVDLPDFNLRLAQRLTALGVPVLLYVSPTVWAWREGRVELLKRDVAQVLCIYPFEEPFLRERGVRARYVGNPLLDALPCAARPLERRGGLRLGLLPGSRQGEVARLLRPMLAAAKQLALQRPVELAIPVAPAISRAALEVELAAAGLAAQLVDGDSRAVLDWAEVAIVKSGTVTLEAALAETPMVVVYKTSPVTALVARAMLRVQHVALPNLLLGRALVPALLQGAATPERMVAAVEVVLARRQALVTGYREVKALLGGAGAAANVADAVARAAEGSRDAPAL